MTTLAPRAPIAAAAARLTPAAARTPEAAGAGLASAARAFASDARHYQIAVLATLVAYGTLALRFDVPPAQIAWTLGGALATQWLATRLAGAGRFEPRSAFISSLSLCLLLRANEPWWGAVAAAIAVGSKFVFRARGKHVLNPTNGALVLLLAAHAPVWVSPAQWGNGAWFAFALACAGGVVVHRSLRSDVTFAFLAGWCAVLFGRALWLGQPFAVPLHQLSSGGVLLFAFFMISDPRTTPDRRLGRVLFGLAVAALAAAIQFALYRPNALLWSLALLSLAVPLVDRALPAARFEWKPAARPEPTRGETDAPTHASPVPARGAH